MLLITPEIINFSKELIIDNDKHLEQVIEEAYELAVQIEEGNQDLIPVNEVLTRAIEEYENKKFELPKRVSAEDMMIWLMEKHGHSQSDMTDVAPRTVINEIVNGKRKLTRNHIVRLCEKYQVTADYFLT